jgi:predicted DNA-binding transcriptional regulator AlpA
MKSHGGTHLTNSTPDRIIREHELRTIVPYSSMHIWRLEKEGRFPARIHCGPGRVGWSLREVMEWVDARKAERSIDRTG